MTKVKLGLGFFRIGLFWMEKLGLSSGVEGGGREEWW